MRNLICLFALSIFAFGCGERAGQPRLEPLARGLAETWQPANRELKLEIHSENKGERVTLHCVLRNVSLAGASLDVDASGLPWLNSDLFNIDAVGADGTVVHRNSIPVVARISGPQRPVAIASGESMEGEIDLGAMPIIALTRNKEWLLLWSYSIGDGHSDKYYSLSGITLVKTKS
jgi:hypothetical protein